jgi:hypothetical protein
MRRRWLNAVAEWADVVGTAVIVGVAATVAWQLAAGLFGVALIAVSHARRVDRGDRR